VHLRAITLAGFKTFAQKTEIRFESGITAIVGPNGSGKTNILDAFKWVLGESSAKDLRGKRMDEVVYAGGTRRARASHAEVEIVIDNSDGRLPIDYEEVAIRRRVDRTGQSDYFLNGSRVRRRDLLELLASTGLTTDSYAMITQRDIESIITSSPEQRRQLIEEAAQVRGVKAKRSEAADRLRELAGNLLRLEDLRGEIEPRLEVVREQAAAAREAAAADQRLEILRGSIVYEEWREARDAHRRAASQAAALTRRLEEARAGAQAAEAEFQAWRQEVQAAQDRRLQRQRLVGAVRLELSSSVHDLAMAEERRACPRDDIVTRLISAEIDDRQLSDDEFGFFVLMLAVAGNETTRNAIAHGMLAFLDHPGQWELFTAERPATTADEIVRWATPITAFQRTATRDATLGGQQIKAGQRVGLFYRSANFDEEVFDHPERFDISRDPNPHLGYGGYGTHYCLGANLAKLEIELIFTAIADAMPDEVADVVRAVLSETAHSQFVVAEVQAAVTASEKQRHRLALWSRRLLGEAISPLYRLLHRDRAPHLEQPAHRHRLLAARDLVRSIPTPRVPSPIWDAETVVYCNFSKRTACRAHGDTISAPTIAKDGSNEALRHTSETGSIHPSCWGTSLC